MDAVDWVGWLSSIVLVMTLGKQVSSQWKSGAYEGVSRWLFVGQFVASAGFTVYSALLKNWVFTATNAVLLVSAVAGQWVSMRNRRIAEGEGEAWTSALRARVRPV